jgi:hypothetical protein
MVVAVEPLEWVDLNRPIGPWVLIIGFALAIPAFVGLCVFVVPSVARGSSGVRSAGTLIHVGRTAY